MKDLWVPVHKNSLPASWRGQSLLEVLVAMAAAILIIGGLVAAVIVAVRNAQFARNQALATKYANEGMENTRSLRDTDWNTFWGVGTRTEGPNPISGTVFSRTIKYEDASGGTNDKMKVTVTVSWTDSAGTHQSELVSFFTKPATWE
ncbi:MAG: Uncharacterized protein LiPW16_371 [Microgenomates group bacterium LiPW_16]|nr:MAG: Uncharacterized protein LiPW16_371 [Microgenomates group bacterium LiPW_16]